VAGIGDPFLEGFEARGLDHVGYVEEAASNRSGTGGGGYGAQAKRTPTINSLQEDEPNTLRQEKTKDRTMHQEQTKHAQAGASYTKLDRKSSIAKFLSEIGETARRSRRWIQIGAGFVVLPNASSPESRHHRSDGRTFGSTPNGAAPHPPLSPLRIQGGHTAGVPGFELVRDIPVC
jgi:hypothetical protein